MSIINKIKDLLTTTDQQSQERIDTTDSFADGLILEFRRAVNEAVINELEKCQEKYLSNILRNSYFPIEAISLIPSDHETALTKKPKTLSCSAWTKKNTTPPSSF
jgi:hypothetical protein